MENRHYQAIPPEVLLAANTAIEQAATALSPYMMTLTPTERQGKVKMGNKSLSFVSKAREYADANVHLCPSYLDMAEFQIDMDDAINLRGVLMKIEQLRDGVDDTILVAGSEAMQSALVFYNSVTEAAKFNVAGAKAIYDDLKARFPGHPVIPVPPAE